MAGALKREVVVRFALPKVLQADNGPGFQANLLRKALARVGITQKFGSVYHPQSQGAVERCNGILKIKNSQNLCTD